jgi:C4-dicarboxylate-specific signal transduction histidine kinase
MGDALRRQASALESLRLREELTHLDRMARLGQLSASLAHELNQPLAATLCNAQAATRLLRQPQPDVLEACSALDDIVASARRAGDVMKQTRALFKGEEPAPQPIDLNALITAVLKLLRDEITFIGAVMIRLDSIIPPVLGNVVQLQQVLINLIKNALDAVKSEGEGNRRITLSTRVAETGTVVLCVADSGSGIKEGEEDRIFQPFHTGKPDGMGMGLPICRQIVKHYGGTITATRLPEGGACFTVSLPASTEA